MTPDEERLRRYLEWRRAGDRDRAERRRRVIGYTAVPAVFLLVVGLATWLGRPSSLPSRTVNAVTPLPESATTAAPEAVGRSTSAAPEAAERATSSAVDQQATTTPAPAPPRIEGPPAPARPRSPSTPRIASRPRRESLPPQQPVRQAPVAVPTMRQDPSADTPDVAAGVAPVTPPAPVSAPPSEVAREVPSAPRPDAWTPSRADAPAPADIPAQASLPAAPAPSDVVAGPSVESTPTPPPSGGAVAVAPPTARERVTNWAKGEVQEFRDGVKREIRDFRSGYDKVRGFFRR